MSALDSHVVDDLPLRRPVAGHHELVPFFLTAEMFGGVPIEIAGGDISALVGRPVADVHEHEVDEVYLLLSPSPGGALIELTIGLEQTTVRSPAVVHIPAGTPHKFVTLAAERGSYCLGLLLGAESVAPSA